METYHTAVGRSAQSLGWRHLVLHGKESIPKNKKNNWFPELNTGPLEFGSKRFLNPFRIVSLFRAIKNFSRSVVAFINQQVKQNEPTIIFIESFNALELLALCLTFPKIKNFNFSFWLLYRWDYSDKYLTGRIYYYLTKFIRKRIPPSRFLLLTDSEILMEYFNSFFKKKFNFLPFTNTLPDLIAQVSNNPKKSKIYCWWAGPPRKEKGLKLITDIIEKSLTMADRFCILASEEAELKEVTGGPEVQLLASNLSRDEYETTLINSDLILQPYDPSFYRYRTSAVFIEAILAKKTPVVTTNTWMAYYLEKFDLSELAIDWNSPQIYEKLLSIYNNDDIKPKLQKLGDYFQKIYNDDYFAVLLKSLFKESFSKK